MEYKVRTMAEMAADGENPEILFWVGCAGSFDERYKKVTKAFVKILNHLDIKFAVLGTEEACTGDPARRAGNEFTFQMLAQQNIQVLNGYGIKKIVTACPHCFNTLKNEYPELGGDYDVVHHSSYLQELINLGKLKVSGGTFKGQKITYHDSCYLGRANDIYEAPRDLIKALDAELVEMKKCVYNLNCDGAGYSDTKILTMFGLDRTDCKTEIVTAAKAFGLDVIDDPAPEQNLFDRSDNVSFAAQGIPAPTYSPGFRKFDDAIFKYYHAVADNPETIDFAYLYKYCQSYAHTARLIANRKTQPKWTPGDKYEAAYKKLYNIK